MQGLHFIGASAPDYDSVLRSAERKFRKFSEAFEKADMRLRDCPFMYVTGKVFFACNSHVGDTYVSEFCLESRSVSGEPETAMLENGNVMDAVKSFMNPPFQYVDAAIMNTAEIGASLSIDGRVARRYLLMGDTPAERVSLPSVHLNYDSGNAPASMMSGFHGLFAKNYISIAIYIKYGFIITEEQMGMLDAGFNTVLQFEKRVIRN